MSKSTDARACSLGLLSTADGPSRKTRNHTIEIGKSLRQRPGVRESTAKAANATLRVAVDPLVVEEVAAAAEAAFDAALEPDPRKRAGFVEQAMAILDRRDELRSLRVALEHRGDSEPLEALRAAEAAFDEQLRPRMRWFTGVNRARRAAASGLSPDEQDAAYWYTERNHCDRLIAQLAGLERPGKHVADCEHCRREVGGDGIQFPAVTRQGR